MPQTEEARLVTLDTLELHDAKLREEIRTIVDKAFDEKRREQRRLEDRLSQLDTILRGDGKGDPGLSAKVTAILDGQRRREWLERAGVGLLLTLVGKAAWELFTR